MKNGIHIEVDAVSTFYILKLDVQFIYSRDASYLCVQIHIVVSVVAWPVESSASDGLLGDQ